MILKYVSVFLLLAINSLFAQPWTGNGPYYKNIKSIAQSSVNPSLLFAGAFGWGVFKSSDGGITWVNQKTGMSNTYVRSLIALSDQVVFAGTNDGVFKTIDGGTSWSLSLGTANSVRSIAFDGLNNILYAATYGSGLYKSANQGTTWSPVIVTDPLTGQTLLRQRVVTVFGNDSIYVGGSISDIDSGGALFRSLNAGNSWAQVQRGSAGAIRSSILSIALNPLSQSTGLIVGTAAKGVARSTNGGTTWLYINGPTTPQPLLDLQVNTVGWNPTQYFAGTDSNGQFYYRAVGDSTVGWTPGTGLPGEPVSLNALKIHPFTNSTLYIGTEGKGTYRSLNAGASWQSINSGMLGVAARALKVNSNGNIILGTEFGDGIWLSTNQAASWTKSETLSTVNSITSIGTTNNPSVMYAGAYGTGIYKSLNGGNWWNLTDSSVINHNVRTIAVHPNNSNTVYAGTGNGVYKSVNGGTVWTATNTGIPSGTSIRSMAIDISNPNTLYVGTDSSYLFKTIDGGSTWSHITNANGFLTQDIFIRCITVDNLSSNIVYAGSDSGRVYKSTTGGSSWSLLSKISTVFSVRSIDLSPNNRNVVFAATFGSGIYVSADTGAHWASLNTGLPDLEVYSLETDQANPLNLYAGTGKNGVFKATYSYVNQPPTLASIGNKSVVAGQTIAFNISATDPNVTIPVLSIQSIPPGAAFQDSGNGRGRFSWTPAVPDIGPHVMTFTASDGSNIDSETITINVLDPTPITVNMQEESGWNLISVPVIPADPTKAALFPTAISSAFGYHGTYTISDTLDNGKGYWLKFGSSQSVSEVGINLPMATVAVQSGWNLIGSLSSSIPVGNVVAIPPVNILSGFFTFSNTNGYIAADSLVPGKAYWVKVDQSGTVVLNSSAPAFLPQKRVLDPPDLQRRSAHAMGIR